MRIQLCPGTTLTTIEGKSVLFSVRTGESFGLNETAAHMLRLALDLGLGPASERMAADYAAPAQEIRADLDALAEELTRAKLAQLLPAHGS